MSREARDWVWSTAPTDDPRQLLILLSLADVADEFGCNAYPSKSRLSNDCRSNPRTVQRHLSALVENGILEVEKKATQHRPTTYRFSALREDKLSPLDLDPTPAKAPQGRLRGDSGETNGDSAPYMELELEVKPPEASPSGDVVKATDDPLTRQAHQLAVFAMEQPVKPAIAVRGRGSQFLAAMGIIEKLLRAGHSVNRIHQAIEVGVEVWTVAGFQTAMAKANPQTAGQRRQAQDWSTLGRLMSEGVPT